MKWAYGVTTVPSRICELLPRTLESLREAGFDKPRLFVDGAKSGFEHFGLETTYRHTNLRTHGNFVLSLYELYIRDPGAERYAMFQDDFVTYVGLKDYLERWYPEKGYLNLYTFPCNQALSRGREGWYESDQLGKGAVALVFSNEAVEVLLTSAHMFGRPRDPIRGHKSVDGGIVDSFRKAGWKEYVHNPSLVQHTGLISSMGNGQHQLSPSFRGQEFDIRKMIRC